MILRLVVLSLALIGFAFSASAKISDTDKKEIEGIVAKYIADNPDKIIAALDSMQQKRAEDQKKQMKKKVRANRKALEQNKADPIIGNPKGDVVIVEFFDYNCGYCKMMFEGVLKFVEKDGKVKWVLKEMPMLSDVSKTAAKAALAADKQGKYKQMHTALMQHKGSLKEEDIMKMAADVGLNVDKLKADMAGKEVADILAANQQMAMEIGINGIPNFIMNSYVDMGGFDVNELPERAKKIRAAKAKAKAKAKDKAKAKADKAKAKPAADNTAAPASADTVSAPAPEVLPAEPGAK